MRLKKLQKIIDEFVRSGRPESFVIAKRAEVIVELSKDEDGVLVALEVANGLAAACNSFAAQVRAAYPDRTRGF